MSDSMWPHGLHHARLLCPRLSPRFCSNSCPLSPWCYLTISSSVTPFSSWLQSFSASASFPRSLLFPSSGQSIGPSQYQSFDEYSRLISFRIYWFDLLAVQWTLKSLLQHRNLKASIIWYSAFFMVQLPMTNGKTIALTRWTFVGKVMSLIFNTIFKYCI